MTNHEYLIKSTVNRQYVHLAAQHCALFLRSLLAGMRIAKCKQTQICMKGTDSNDSGKSLNKLKRRYSSIRSFVMLKPRLRKRLN